LAKVSWQGKSKEISCTPCLLRKIMLKHNIDNQELPAPDPTPMQCVQDLIESQVVISPDALALQCGEERLTYLELNQRANKLARYLQSLGVGAETLVGICMNRSIEMVVAILGVLKAGGAYIPLDPTYPRDRLAFVLCDAQCKYVITQSETLRVLPMQDGRSICLDSDWDHIALQSGENLEKTSNPANLAYVIYTSGSTGKPKGVMITHANLCHFVRIVRSALDVYPTDKYLQTASIAYALSVRQLIIPLSCGASIILANSDQALDPFALFEFIKTQKVTLMDMVPSFWRTSVQRLSDLPALDRKQLLTNDLRRIVSVGEPLSSDIPRDWRFKLENRANLVNIFGQTEITGVVATYSIQFDEQVELTGIVPIGRSVMDTQLYVLDSHLKPVAPGEAGELCVSNPCLARGYLNLPELTAEKFISNPFSDRLSDRLYRTGDLARYREDGMIEFLGRGDHQVKIRGQRLELGEVESVLREFPGVRDCVVMAWGSLPDEKYLAAYIVSPVKIVDQEIRRFMGGRVPNYMIPSVFLFLESLPLTPNGKVNRLALPEPDLSSRKNIAAGFDQPGTDLEQRIAAIWKELLKLDRVGIHDNFFELGGHSFVAVRLFARIERDLEVRLPITTLFHATTISQISNVILQQDKTIVHWDVVVPIRVKGDKPPFFGVHGHEGGVLFWISLMNYWPKDQPFYAIQAQGVDGEKPALRHIEDMAKLYIREMQKIQPRGPYFIGGYSMGGEIAFEMSQQLYRQGEMVNLLVMLDTYNPKRVSSSIVQDTSGEMAPMVEAQTQPDRKVIWRQKLARHFRLLFRLSLREKINYILRDFSYRVERVFLYSFASLYLVMGKRLPDSVLLNYLRKSHSQALYRYVPIQYPGKITLFRSNATSSTDSDDSPLGWGSLAAGGFEVFRFDATHNILNVVYAKEVASRLIESLIQAQDRN
jgi:aspartate racemase